MNVNLYTLRPKASNVALSSIQSCSGPILKIILSFDLISLLYVW